MYFYSAIEILFADDWDFSRNQELCGQMQIYYVETHWREFIILKDLNLKMDCLNGFFDLLNKINVSVRGSKME